MIEITLNETQDGHEDLTGESVKINETITKCYESYQSGNDWTAKLNNGWQLYFIYDDPENDNISGHWELVK